MEVGTAIFLSSIVLALVGLYAVTKDRWAWRRTVSRIIITCLVLLATVLVLILAIAGYQYWEQRTGQLTAKQLPAKPSRQTEYTGLRLSMTKNEVLYVKGIPSQVLKKDEAKKEYTAVETKEWTGADKETRVKTYETWAFEGYDHTLYVFFTNKTRDAVSNIRCYPQKDGWSKYACPDISGIHVTDSEAGVNRKLGPPTRSRIDGVTKTLAYDDVGIEFMLTKEKVYGISIGAPPFETDR